VNAAARSNIADPSLAPRGEQRIAWVARHSPVLNRLARVRLADGALRGRRVAVVVHLEAKTAYLATILADAGAQVVASGSNPGSTQDAICAALVARGIEVHARHGASAKEFHTDLLAVAESAARLGWGSAGVTASPLPGPAGNVEYFVWLHRDAPPPTRDAVDAAVAAGPAGEKVQR